MNKCTTAGNNWSTNVNIFFFLKLNLLNNTLDWKIWKIYAKRMGGPNGTNFVCVRQNSIKMWSKTNTIPNLKINWHFADCKKTSKNSKPKCIADVNGQVLGRHFYPRSRFTPASCLRGHGQILRRPTKMFIVIKLSFVLWYSVLIIAATQCKFYIIEVSAAAMLHGRNNWNILPYPFYRLHK